MPTVQAVINLLTAIETLINSIDPALLVPVIDAATRLSV